MLNLIILGKRVCLSPRGEPNKEKRKSFCEGESREKRKEKSLKKTPISKGGLQCSREKKNKKEEENNL